MRAFAAAHAAALPGRRGSQAGDLLVYAAPNVTAPAEGEARAKHEQYRSHVVIEAALVPLSGGTGVDFSRYPRDATVGYIDSEAGRCALASFSRSRGRTRRTSTGSIRVRAAAESMRDVAGHIAREPQRRRRYRREYEGTPRHEPFRAGVAVGRLSVGVCPRKVTAGALASGVSRGLTPVFRAADRGKVQKPGSPRREANNPLHSRH